MLSSLIISCSLLALLAPEVRRAIPIGESSSLSASQAAGNARIASITANDSVSIKEAQFSVAESFYQRKEYEIASVEFQKFLHSSIPGDLHRDQALFHLGETYRSLDKNYEAQIIYQQLLKEIASGEIAASASYRMGEYYHSEKELRKAIEAFSKAAQLSKNIKIQNAARYQQGVCDNELRDQEKATIPFDKSSKTTDDPTARLATLLLLANEDEKRGFTEKALQSYLALSGESAPKIAVEALVKAGMIETQQKNKEEALSLFQKASDLKEDPWSPLAALEIMQLAYADKDYQKVLEKSPQAITTSNTEQCSQALLLTAQAERQLGHFQKALELNERLVKEFSGTPAGHDAAFMRLLLLRSLKDSSLLAQLQDFILTTTDSYQKAQASLLQAEVFFEQGEYSPAAKAYAIVKNSDLSSSLKADAAYKEAWSLQHLGEITSALGAYTTFLTTYPESPSAPDALIQRAYLEQKQGDLKTALADYNQFLEKYPKATECELVFQQKALVLKTQGDHRGMVDTFQQLLATYPKSSAAAEANYWIGWNFFKEKNYQAAIPFLEKSKTLNVKKFREKAVLRLLLCHYYLEQSELAMRDAEELPLNLVPVEVSRWIGLKAYQQDNFKEAEQFLNRVITSNDPHLITRDVAMALAESLIKEGKYQEAKAPIGKALDLATDPASRAAALFSLAKIEQELGNVKKAESFIQEVLLLQPDGTLNLKGRLLMKSILDKSKTKNG